MRCYQRRTRAVCIREIQRTLQESVRQLLIDYIDKHGLRQDFDVKADEIRGPNESLIIFRGMQEFNKDNIKSLENFDVAWIEEAHTLSAGSFTILRPTIRVAGSSIWCSWSRIRRALPRRPLMCARPSA